MKLFYLVLWTCFCQYKITSWDRHIFYYVVCNGLTEVCHVLAFFFLLLCQYYLWWMKRTVDRQLYVCACLMRLRVFSLALLYMLWSCIYWPNPTFSGGSHVSFVINYNFPTLIHKTHWKVQPTDFRSGIGCATLWNVFYYCHSQRLIYTAISRDDPFSFHTVPAIDLTIIQRAVQQYCTLIKYHS